ncbi:MAG: hypothetical protein P1U40_05415 [Coxiellaceae bacterium]|nr:hypothetical protein [Coxiellaceae bacterium]
MNNQIRLSVTGLALTALVGTAYAYDGFNDCSRYSGLNDSQRSTYKQSSICVPVANVSGQEISVTLLNSKTQGDTRTINNGNVGEFTHNNQVPRGTAFNIVVKNAKGKVIYDSVKGKDAKAINLMGLMCLKNNDNIKCVPWVAIKPQKQVPFTSTDAEGKNKNPEGLN